MILKNQKGIVLANAIVFMYVLIFLGVAITSLIVFSSRFSQKTYLEQKALYLAEGGIDKSVWALNNIQNYTGENKSPLEDGGFDITISELDSNNKIIEVIGHIPNTSPYKIQRKLRVRVTTVSSTENVSFHYAIQSGAGGFILENNAVIKGNVYSNGDIIGQNKFQSQVEGDAWAVTKISTLTVKKSGGAGGNAHYASIENAIVEGNQYQDFPPPQDLPSLDASFWKDKAQEGGEINQNPYKPANNTTIGPVKINGDLVIDGGNTLIIAGTVWVTGDITIGNNSILKLSGGYGNFGGVLVTDGKVNIGEGSSIGEGADHPLLILCENNSLDSKNPAVILGNGSLNNAVLAKNGMVKLNNNADIKAVAANKILVSQNAVVKYSSGLASAWFSSGPGGKWVFKPGSWEIIY